MSIDSVRQVGVAPIQPGQLIPVTPPRLERILPRLVVDERFPGWKYDREVKDWISDTGVAGEKPTVLPTELLRSIPFFTRSNLWLPTLSL